MSLTEERKNRVIARHFKIDNDPSATKFTVLTEERKNHIIDRHFKIDNDPSATKFTVSEDWVWEKIQDILLDPDECVTQYGHRMKLVGYCNESIGKFSFCKSPIFNISIIYDALTNEVITAYPDPRIHHHPKDYYKNFVCTFKGRPSLSSSTNSPLRAN